MMELLTFSHCCEQMSSNYCIYRQEHQLMRSGVSFGLMEVCSSPTNQHYFHYYCYICELKYANIKIQS